MPFKESVRPGKGRFKTKPSYRRFMIGPLKQSFQKITVYNFHLKHFFQNTWNKIKKTWKHLCHEQRFRFSKKRNRMRRNSNCFVTWTKPAGSDATDLIMTYMSEKSVYTNIIHEWFGQSGLVRGNGRCLCWWWGFVRISAYIYENVF